MTTHHHHPVVIMPMTTRTRGRNPSNNTGSSSLLLLLLLLFCVSIMLFLLVPVHVAAESVATAMVNTMTSKILHEAKSALAKLENVRNCRDVNWHVPGVQALRLVRCGNPSLATANDASILEQVFGKVKTLIDLRS